MPDCRLRCLEGKHVEVGKEWMWVRPRAWVPELIRRLRADEVHLAAAVLGQLPLPQHLLVLLRRCARHRSALTARDLGRVAHAR